MGLGFGMKLYPHQARALDWLSTRPKAILALDMGLGKTCVSSKDLIAPAVVICPASLKLNWQDELSAWRPELSTQVIASPKDKPNGSDVTIVNYDILQRVDLPKHTTLIVDEAHYIKSYKAKRTKHVMTMMQQAEKVRLLTGTPIVNRPIELWTLLYGIKAIKSGYFEFGMRYCAGWRTPWDTYDFSGASRHDELANLLKPHMLRMRKEDVIDLPSKTFRVIELDLPIDEREKQFDRQAIEKPDSVAFEAIADILKMNALRKLPDAITYIKDCLCAVDKVVVFAHHKDVIDQLKDALSEFKPVVITGATAQADRHKNVLSFQNSKDCKVFIGNIKAAGVGLTLTAASHVVFVESSWSPADINQAADRCHRIGQKDNVTVDLLTINGSIDALVLHSVLNKMDVIDRIIKEENIMDTTLIAQKLRELAALFEEVPTSKAEVAHEPKAEVAPEPKVQEPTLDDIRTAIAQLIGSGKRDKAVEIIKNHGAAKVSDIQPSHFASVMEAINGAR
jgi:SWI/SNF-related matrix-associated actin-dependent regulator 1 of chromatin subfamily A